MNVHPGKVIRFALEFLIANLDVDVAEIYLGLDEGEISEEQYNLLAREIREMIPESDDTFSFIPEVAEWALYHHTEEMAALFQMSVQEIKNYQATCSQYVGNWNGGT